MTGRAAGSGPGTAAHGAAISDEIISSLKRTRRIQRTNILTRNSLCQEGAPGSESLSAEALSARARRANTRPAHSERRPNSLLTLNLRTHRRALCAGETHARHPLGGSSLSGAPRRKRGVAAARLAIFSLGGAFPIARAGGLFKPPALGNRPPPGQVPRSQRAGFVPRTLMDTTEASASSRRSALTLSISMS